MRHSRISRGPKRQGSHRCCFSLTYVWDLWVIDVSLYLGVDYNKSTPDSVPGIQARIACRIITFAAHLRESVSQVLQSQLFALHAIVGPGCYYEEQQVYQTSFKEMDGLRGQVNTGRTPPSILSEPITWANDQGCRPFQPKQSLFTVNLSALLSVELLFHTSTALFLAGPALIVIPLAQDTGWNLPVRYGTCCPSFQTSRLAEREARSTRITLRRDPKGYAELRPERKGGLIFVGLASRRICSRCGPVRGV